MGEAAAIPRLTLAEYVAREAESDVRHEFVHGEVYAMAGGSPRHAAITMNVGGALIARLRGTACRPTSGDQRLYIPRTGCMFYADVVVVCGDYLMADADPRALTNPTLIIEVLSRSTADHDRGTKYEHYRTLPSLRDYVLIAQDAVAVEHRERVYGNTWLVRHLTEGALELKSLGIRLPLDEIYADLDRVPHVEGT